MKEENFLGLTKKAAQNKAEENNLIFRLIRIDSKDYFSYPPSDDLRSDRVCVEIENNKVVKAVFQ